MFMWQAILSRFLNGRTLIQFSNGVSLRYQCAAQLLVRTARDQGNGRLTIQGKAKAVWISPEQWDSPA